MIKDLGGLTLESCTVCSLGTHNFILCCGAMCNILYLHLAQEPLLKDLDLLKVSDWYGVGLQLDVPQCDLDVIKENHHDEKRRKREMFILWLKITDKPSYIKLARALFLAEENNIAHKICKRYGKWLF